MSATGSSGSRWEPELFVTLFTYEAKFQTFPLNWLIHLTIPQLRFLYDEYKKGNIRNDFLIAEVSSEGYFDTMVKESQELPFFKQRTRFIEQIIDNHKKKQYASSINLILPQIEAFIWIIAAYLQKIHKIKIFTNAPIKIFWDFNPTKYKKIKLITRKGKIITKKHTIKKLIAETQINKFMNDAQINYFIHELFEERNPILHGNIINYDSEIDSCKKIICLNHLIKSFIDEITKIPIR